MGQKKFTKKLILKAAFDLLRKQGACRFSAKNIARQLGSSVQPLYSEFDNMEELENDLFECLFFYFVNKVCLSKRADENSKVLDPIVAMGLNYLDFAKNESKLYQAIYVRKFVRRYSVKECLRDVFNHFVSSTTKYEGLNEKEINKLFSGMLVLITGLAFLLSSEIIYLTKEQQIDFLERMIPAILRKDSLFDLSVLFV